ncbi:hypothetical protein OROHE_009673 [Orobanche hederae]
MFYRFVPDCRCAIVRDLFTSVCYACTAAIIIDSHTPRTVTAKGKQNTLHEYAAVDELLKPFIITFWNDAAPDDIYILLDQAKDRHIIAALNSNVTDYHNISLSSTSASVVLMNSKIERVQALQQWGILYIKEKLMKFNSRAMYSRKRNQISASTLKHSHLSKRSLQSNSETTDLPSAFKGDCFPQIKDSSTHPAPNVIAWRLRNMVVYLNVIPAMKLRMLSQGYRFSLLIYDSTGEMEVTIFGNEVEKIMQMSASDFINKYSNARLLTIDSITSNLHLPQLKMKVHYKFFNKQDGTSMLSHTVQSLECHQLPSSIISTSQLPSSSISTHNIPATSSADVLHSPSANAKIAEISEIPQPNTTPLISSLKDHPRPDLQTSMSSRGRAFKTKRAE